MATKGKGKGDQLDEATQQLLESNKRELLDQYFTMKKLQERVHRLEGESGDLREERDEIKNYFDEKKEKYEDMIELHRTEIDQLKEDKQKAEYENEKSKKELAELRDDIDRKMEDQRQAFEKERSELLDKNLKLEARLDNVDNFIKNKADLENERRMLKEQLEIERKEKLRDLADKDRDKVQATDKLKKDMLHKIQETKTSLLALKKEQLQTTTRLTVLQNHQLTTELEYQSKQTEKLLFKNSKLQEQINALKRDVEIHKQVEQELAKRSHFCQKLIKKLTARIKELEDDLEEKANANNNNNNSSSAGQDEKNPRVSELEDRKKDEIINSLEKHLKAVEKKLAKVQNDCDIVKNENYYLQTKIETSDQKYGNLASIISTNLENLRGQQQSTIYEDIIEQQANGDLSYQIDLNSVRSKEVVHWTPAEREGIMTLLLAQIRPLMSKKNLMQTQGSQSNSILANQSINIIIMDDQQQQQLQQQQQQMNQTSNRSDNPLSLPRINQMSEMRETGYGGEDQVQENNNMNVTQGGLGSATKKFQDVPLDISTKIVKSSLRDWGKPASTLPGSNNRNQNRRFKVV